MYLPYTTINIISPQRYKKQTTYTSKLSYFALFSYSNCLILQFFHTQTVLFCNFFALKLSYFASF